MNERTESSAKIGVLLAILSLALLAASIKWAHHMNGVRADLLVSCWGVTAGGALAFSIRALRVSNVEIDVAPILVKLGIWLAVASLAALALAGLAAAAGTGPACGGG